LRLPGWANRLGRRSFAGYIPGRRRNLGNSFNSFIETDGKALTVNEHISRMNQEGKEINERIYDFPKLVEKLNILPITGPT